MNISKGQTVQIEVSRVLMQVVALEDIVFEPIGQPLSLYDKLIDILCEMTYISDDVMRNTRKGGCAYYRAMAYECMLLKRMTMAEIGKQANRSSGDIAYMLKELKNACDEDYVRWQRERFKNIVIKKSIL